MREIFRRSVEFWFVWRHTKKKKRVNFTRNVEKMLFALTISDDVGLMMCGRLEIVYL